GLPTRTTFQFRTIRGVSSFIASLRLSLMLCRVHFRSNNSQGVQTLEDLQEGAEERRESIL
ncbi:MAG: hypothetical protein ACREF9_03940, partial [Opitutaceae bacterium]